MSLGSGVRSNYLENNMMMPAYEESYPEGVNRPNRSLEAKQRKNPGAHENRNAIYDHLRANSGIKSHYLGGVGGEVEDSFTYHGDQVLDRKISDILGKYISPSKTAKEQEFDALK